MTIELLLICGFVAGIVVGGTVARAGLGCFLLLAIPAAMIAYVSWWQGQNPEAIRSTSALDYLFVPLWPSLGAIGGFIAGRVLRGLSLKP